MVAERTILSIRLIRVHSDKNEASANAKTALASQHSREEAQHQFLGVGKESSPIRMFPDKPHGRRAELAIVGELGKMRRLNLFHDLAGFWPTGSRL